MDSAKLGFSDGTTLGKMVGSDDGTELGNPLGTCEGASDGI